MGGFGPRSKMRGFVLLSLAFLLSSFFIGPMEGAKGGAKSAMNRRGKSKDSGRRGQGAGREDDDEDIGGQGDKSVPYAKRPCVGLCYILKMKAKGIKPKQLEAEVENMRKRRPCIGLCTATGSQKPRVCQAFCGSTQSRRRRRERRKKEWRRRKPWRKLWRVAKIS